MKAYNSPTDELHIKSNSGEELVKITPSETTIKNMDLSSLGVESTPEEIDAVVNFGKALTVTASELNSGVEKGNMLPTLDPVADFPYREIMTNEDVDGYIYKARVTIHIEAVEGENYYVTDMTAAEFKSHVQVNNQILIEFDGTVFSLPAWMWLETHDYAIPITCIVNSINADEREAIAITFQYVGDNQPFRMYIKTIPYSDSIWYAERGTNHGPRIVMSYADYQTLLGGTPLTAVLVIDSELLTPYIDVNVVDTDNVIIATARAYYNRSNIVSNIDEYQSVSHADGVALNISINRSNISMATLTAITL